MSCAFSLFEREKIDLQKRLLPLLPYPGLFSVLEPQPITVRRPNRPRQGPPKGPPGLTDCCTARRCVQIDSEAPDAAEQPLRASRSCARALVHSVTSGIIFFTLKLSVV